MTARKRSDGRLKKLLQNPKLVGAASLTTADIAGKAVSFFITPYVANRMGAASFGSLNLYLSTTEILIFAISLGGSVLITTEYVRNGYTPARRMRAANLELSMWITAGLIVVLLLLSRSLPSAVPAVSGLLILAVSWVQALNQIQLAYYRGAQAYPVAIAGQLTVAALNVLLTVLVFEFGSPTANNRLLCIALAYGLVQIAYAFLLSRHRYDLADKTTKRSETFAIFRFGLSISVHVASGWIRSSIDRFVVAGFLGLAAAGVYSVAVSLAAAQILLFAAISQQLQPFLYRRLKSRDFAGFQRVQFVFAAGVLGFTGVYYAALQVGFGVLFASEYAGAKALLPMLLAGAAAQSLLTNFSHAAFYERRAGLISWISAISLLIHVVGLVTLALLQRISPANIAFVFFMSTAVAMLGMVWLWRRVLAQLRAVPVEPEQESTSPACGSERPILGDETR